MFDWHSLIDYKHNPVITPPFPDWIIADPVVISAIESPDKNWHLFAHGVLGIYHYTSTDGINWTTKPKLLFTFSVRPFIYQEKGVYYLLYEKITSPWTFPFYNSHLEIRRSTNLFDWSEPTVVLTPALPWHKRLNAIGNVGNPCLVKVGKEYRLYYSGGLLYVPDCGFCEPHAIGMATSRTVVGPYTSRPQPLSLPKITNKIRTFPTALRVYTHGSGFIGLQTCISFNSNNKSSAHIRGLTSRDGFDWDVAHPRLITPNKLWKRSHVYVGDLKQIRSETRIYFNARNGWRLGREFIGLARSV